MKTATLRTYHYKYDKIDKWRCPSCGYQNEYYGDKLEDTCLCGEKVKLVYRRIRGKNY